MPERVRRPVPTPAEDQARDPMCQRLGLAGASARRNQQRWRGSVTLANAISDSTLLRRVQPLQYRVGGRAAAIVFRFCSTTDWITLPIAEGNRAKFKNAPAPV